MKRMHMIPTLIAAVFMSAAISAHGMDVKNMDVKKSGSALVSSSGMTVYTFDKDVAGNGKSGCYGACAELWPAVVATDANPQAQYAAIKRDDGVTQLTYKGKPLYRYSADKKPGDANGDNFKNMWHAVKD